MNIQKATKQYEEWLRENIPLLPDDLNEKHTQMATAPFPFLRATYYRWAQRFPRVCADIAQAPTVLAVGDLHIENFGSWRDAEGRLIWGINDFDEVTSLPYTNDLVRLATSAILAIEASNLRLKSAVACDVILQGYQEGIQNGGRPFVLAEENRWLEKIARSSLRDPTLFWQKMNTLTTLETPIPTSARRALEEMMPAPNPPYRVVHRVSGLGSLGRERYVALYNDQGGMAAREAKALAPSAALWAQKQAVAGENRSDFYTLALNRSVRAPDPLVRVKSRWIVRRLAPDCCRIELSSLTNHADEKRFLYAMGWETANVHLSSKKAAKAVLANLSERATGWLCPAAEAMTAAVKEDYAEWQRSWNAEVALPHPNPLLAKEREPDYIRKRTL